MKRYKITVSYLGTNYCGWQTQKNGTSVQSVLENAFSKLFGAKTAVTGSGRTDAGVHALGQVAHFDAETSIPAEKIPFAINTMLPEDVRVLSCEEVLPDFHARFQAKEKTYVYKLYLSPHLNPLKNATAENVCVPLDFEKMEKAARFIEGTHDFRCFEASGSFVKDTVRTVEKVEIIKNGEDVEIRVTGNGFLYNMVRIIAGTLVDVGKGKIAANDVEDIIKSGDRVRAGKTLPAKGLTLYSVKYKLFRSENVKFAEKTIF